MKKIQEAIEEEIEQELENHFFSNISEIKKAKYFINFGAKFMQEKFCDSEFLQRIRSTKSDAEARRLIRAKKSASEAKELR